MATILLTSIGLHKAFNITDVGATRTEAYQLDIRRFIRGLHIATLVSLVAIAGCDREIRGREVQRSSSPDGIVDAVLLERDAGSTASTPYEIYLVPKGTKNYIPGTAVFRADNQEALNLTWIGRTLDISYQRARIFHFTNFWNSAQIDNFQYLVELRLNPEKKVSN
jgi:hypothetical protein